MQILTKEEFDIEKNSILEKIRNGSIFIHPTDTIYGIGCNALSSELVSKVREIKGRPDQPFSVIAPSKEWIYEKCIVIEEANEWIEKLPGPLTLILKLKENCVAQEVSPGLDTIGIRMPDHWFKDVVAELGFPVITTSTNRKGENFMTSIDDLDSRIKGKIDFVIYEGEKKGKPSKIIHLEGKLKIIER